jgi:O-antigen biosynthesis protein
MASDLISAVLIGHDDPDAAEKLRLLEVGNTEADGFEARAWPDDRDLLPRLADARPHAIVTFGDIADYGQLNRCPMELRRRWIHIEDRNASLADIAGRVVQVFLDVALNDRFPQVPLVSVFTPTYCTGDRLLRPYLSLVGQTYDNWEWVIYDDSPDDQTFKIATQLAESDPRVKLFRSHANCGVIGEVKRRAVGLSQGPLIVELDHDDELTDHCLADLVEGYNRHPQVGFFYSDCAERFENGDNGHYPDGYGFGFGSYRSETYRDQNYLVCNYPSINAKTVRHIVGMPNHVRAWRRSAYDALGGYSPEIHVADDYELCIRTFLTTPMLHIQRFGYIQYLSMSGGNTQRRRNAEIQRLVRLFAASYEDRIHERFVELGVDDFIWRDGQLDWSIPNPDPSPIANLVMR